MGQRTADGIGEVRADEQAWIGRCFSVRIVAVKFEIFALLPPSVLASDGAGRDRVRDPRGLSTIIHFLDSFNLVQVFFDIFKHCLSVSDFQDQAHTFPNTAQ